MKDITEKLNTIKDNYAPDKIRRLKDFEEFVKDLQVKKSKLLEELASIEQTIERKKDIYYGLIAKQDLLEEKFYQMQEQEKKLGLREQFVSTLEEAIKLKTHANV